MAKNDVPTTVAALIARVGQTSDNLAKHRAAMAQVALAAKASQPKPQGEGVTPQ